jgi:predicted hydrocarbon binding protein
VHGVIFTSLRDYLSATHGPELTRNVFSDQPSFRPDEAYPDEHVFLLIERAALGSGRAVDAVLHDFGVFTAITTFPRLYPAFFAIAPTAHEFLLTVEARIHELVRATIPNAVPPKLTVTELDEHSVSIDYSSERKLCVLLRGLVQGTASHYGEQATLEEKTCMHRGEPACRFEVRLSPARSV